MEEALTKQVICELFEVIYWVIYTVYILKIMKFENGETLKEKRCVEDFGLLFIFMGKHKILFSWRR